MSLKRTLSASFLHLEPSPATIHRKLMTVIYNGLSVCSMQLAIFDNPKPTSLLSCRVAKEFPWPVQQPWLLPWKHRGLRWRRACSCLGCHPALQPLGIAVSDTPSLHVGRGDFSSPALRGALGSSELTLMWRKHAVEGEELNHLVIQFLLLGHVETLHRCINTLRARVTLFSYTRRQEELAPCMKSTATITKTELVQPSGTRSKPCSRTPRP